MRRFAVILAAVVSLGVAGCSGSTGGSGGSGSTAEAEYQQKLDNGFDLLRQQRYADAKTVFADLAQKHPDDGTVALALGVAHHELGEWDAAEAQYQKAVRNGARTNVAETIRSGQVTNVTETVTIADLGTRNLEELRTDRPQ